MSAHSKIPLKDFFRNPEKAYFLISPDGEYISHTEPYKSNDGPARMNIFVQKIGKEEVERVTAVTDRDIWEYFWKGDNRLLYVKDKGGNENYHIYAVDIHTKEEKDLTPFDNVRAQIIDKLKGDQDRIIVGLNKRNPEVFDAYMLNTSTGELEMIAENPGGVAEWVTDHNGVIRMAVSTDGVNNVVLYRDNSNEEFKSVLNTNFKETVSPLFFTFDNRNIYARSNIGRDKIAIVKMDPTTSEELETLFEHEEVDVDRLSYSYKRKVLKAINYTTWKTEWKFLDEYFADLNKTLSDKFPDYEVVISSINRDEDKMVIRVFNDRTTGSYYFYDKNTADLSLLSHRNPWLDEQAMARMKPIKYTSRDGLTIHSYLTLPNGVEAKNLPIVVNPHGGPWVRDRWGFNKEVQFLASRGYAVLQMNFRGSVGYGKKFWEASFKQWGRDMQNDITDGVNWLIEEGIADPKRVAIYGASYGGYATLAGLTYTPDLYACGIDYVGVSNMFTFMETIPPYWKPFLEMMYEMVGNPETEKDLFTAISPALNAEKIKAPLFVAQGANDPRVNIAESDQMVEALRKRGVDVEYMVKNNEGHGFANVENQFDFYRAMEQFLEKHLNHELAPSLAGGEG